MQNEEVKAEGAMQDAEPGHSGAFPPFQPGGMAVVSGASSLNN
jgi:hypothetical protein